MDCLLPPEKEVWGKVIFSEASVILFTGGGGLPTGGSSLGGGCIQGRDLHLGGGVCLWRVYIQGIRGLHLGEGVCLQGVHIQGGLGNPRPESEKRAVRILLECFLVF